MATLGDFTKLAPVIFSGPVEQVKEEVESWCAEKSRDFVYITQSESPMKRQEAPGSGSIVDDTHLTITLWCGM